METLDVVTNEYATKGTAARAAPHHGKHIDDGDLAEEVVAGIVENAAYRIVRAAHDALHTVDRTEIVTAVDAVASASPDQDVLVVVRHADHFVWHNLPQREHKIEAAVCDQAIRLCWPCVV